MRFLLLTVFTILALGVFLPTVHASESNVEVSDLHVTIHGEPVVFTDQGPIIINDQTFVPVREVFETLGFQVGWEDETKTVTLSGNGHVINIFIGETSFIVDQSTFVLTEPAQIINGRTMLPLRGILGRVGYHLNWNEATRTIEIEPRPTYHVSIRIDEEDSITDRATELIEFLKSNIREETNVSFIFASEYAISFGQSIFRDDYEEFSLDRYEIRELALKHLDRISPLDFHVINLRFEAVAGEDSDGSNKPPSHFVDLSFEALARIESAGLNRPVRIVKCDITALPKINGLPVYSHMILGLFVGFDNEGIISAEVRIPEDFKSTLIVGSFLEEIPYDKIMNALDDSLVINSNDLEIRQAYFLTMNYELIPIYVVGELGRVSSQLFRGDTGAVFSETYERRR